jgi:GTP-binding protein EngB required for normal cell division
MNTFGSNHARILVAGFLDLHHQIEEMEAFLAHIASSSALSERVNDISPTEAKVIQDYFARIRSTMLACLQENGVPLDIRRTSLRWTLQTRASFLHVGIAELGPEQLRGYGELSPAARDQLVKIQEELDRLVDRLGAYLRQGLGEDLSQRLTRLEANPGTLATLKLLGRVVTRWQLVEFRPLLDTILKRLEYPQYEIAVFGRVNSGKSSLLNHVVGLDVLPVGVTPITAIPTRLVRGDGAFARIQFAEREAIRIGLEVLSEYASEEGNPDNRKRVTGITVHVSSPRLRDGVVLVDTPGIGSLALAGGAETLAYLPRCDLGVLLIDAATTLNQDDLAVLRALYEAGIPAQVLVSKADLLASADEERTRHYVRQQIQRELNLDLQVHPVSTVGSHERLLTEWFEHEIEPLFERHRALTEKSLERKIAHVRESVVAVLQTMASKRGEVGKTGGNKAAAERAEQLLNQAENAVLRTRERCQNWPSDAPAMVESILRDAAQGLVKPPASSERPGNDVLLRVIQDTLLQRAQMTRQVASELQQTLRRTLEAIQGITGLSSTDISPVRDFILSELPILVLSGLREKLHPSSPWWRALLPRWAVPILRQWLETRHGPTIHECVKAYNDQLEVWMKERIARLAELYQSQAEVLREQVRRTTARGASVGGAADLGELMRDLGELQSGSESGQVRAVSSTTP